MIRTFWSGCCMALLVVAMEANGGFVSDSFDSSNDYLANGTAGTVWDGFLYNFANGNATVYAANANTSNAGQLTFTSVNGNWENNDDDGILLYKTVTGDFDASFQVLGMNNVGWHDGGLMARVPDLSVAGGGEDWVAVKYAAFDGKNGVRSVDDGATTTTEFENSQPWLRLKRVGNTFLFYRGPDGTNWTQLASLGRADMTSSVVQVGLWHATFSGNEGTAQFDNFSLKTGSAWGLATGGSWATAGNWTLGVPGGQADWAEFTNVLSATASVVLDGDRTLGYLTFASTSSYALEAGTETPSSALVIDDTTGVQSFNPVIEVFAGNHFVNVPLVLSNGVTVATESQTSLTVNKVISGNGTLTKSGGGTLSLTSPNTYGGGTLVQAGTMKLSPLPVGTQAFYTFDNASNIGQDSGVMGNDLSGAVGWDAPVYTSDGKFGGAAYFNGNSVLTRSTFPAGVPTGGTPYTMALWEKDDGSSDTGGFLGWGNNAGNQCNNFRFHFANGLNNYWWGNDWANEGLSVNPKDGNWHHIAITWDGATQAMYVDGSSVGTVSRSGLNAQAASFVVGKTTADVCFKGWMDNLLIANRALSASEVAELSQDARRSNLLPSGTVAQISSGAVLDLNGASQTLAELGGAGRVMNSSVVQATLTVGGDNGSAAYSGTLDGPVALSKVGSGALTLSGVNAYSGGTTVSQGTLVLSAPSLQGILTNSYAWFDASDAGTITTDGGGQVTLWKNKGTTGSTLDAVQITSGVGPTVAANALNGRSTLSVDGVTALRTQNNLGISGAAARTVFAVGCRKNNGNCFLVHSGNGYDNHAFGIASQPEFLFAYTWGGDILFTARDNDAYEIYDFSIANGYGTANVITRSAILSGSRAMAPATDDTPLYLGSRFDVACWGNLAEVIVFNRAVSPAERTGIEAYLKAKWFAGDDLATALTAGSVSVASGAVVDLGGTDQTVTGLGGSGTVQNGALTVIGTVAPGGTNAVGTLTLASSNNLSQATLLIDVAAGGVSDRLMVQGKLDLTGATLQIADTSKLQQGNRYVIATCEPGGLTGAFAASNLSATPWTVSYNNAVGEVNLATRGLLFTIR